MGDLTSVIELHKQDPIYVGLTFVLGVVIILIAISKPIMNLVKEYKSTGVDSSRAAAESKLFDQLSAQLDKNSKDILQLVEEKNEYFQRATKLEYEVERLRIFETQIVEFKVQIAEKNDQLAIRENEVRELNALLRTMGERIHVLELRLERDEKQMCKDCPNASGDLFTDN